LLIIGLNNFFMRCH